MIFTLSKKMQICAMIKKPGNKQHHGNLKEALVLAGMQLLDDEGLDALTLRRCAALAGVSHAAPAHHFNGLKGLKTAIATRGYAIFEKSMRDGIKAARPDKWAQAVGMVFGYVKFATEHNAMFNLIFDSPDKFIHSPEWDEAGTRARQVLSEASFDIVDGLGGPSATEVTFFALAHGYAKLIEIGRVVPGSGDARDVKLEDVMSRIQLEAKPD